MKRFLVAAVLALALTPAHAINHGFDPDAPATRWMESLKMPPYYGVSCCGLSDMYPVDRYRQLPNGDYEVWIEDGSAKVFPDGARRIAWDVTVPVIVPKGNVNREEDDLDNPWDHGVVFFSPREPAIPADGSEPPPATTYTSVYCFVRHPRGQ